MSSQFRLPEPLNVSARSRRLDDASEALLARYGAQYAGERSAGAVRGEISQLRTVTREGQLGEGLLGLDQVLSSRPCLVRVLTHPAIRPSATTASRRLAAIQRGIALLFGPEEGNLRIAELQASLPQSDLIDWYQSGVAIAGDTKRRRHTRPTISPQELLGIVQSVPSLRHPLRDRTIVAVHCFSGLTVEEIRTLAWKALQWEQQLETWSAVVERHGERTRLPIFGPAGSLLAQLRLQASPEPGTVFANARGESLTAVQLRRIVVSATSAAGFHNATRSELHAATSALLHQAGFTEHEISIALGTRTVATIDRRLARHLALEAQRAAR